MTGRFRAVCRLDLAHNFGRPLFWIWILILGFIVWGLSGGNVRIASGDSSVGGTKSFLTSEFANAQLMSMVVLLFYGFFIAVSAGMAIIRDEELKVSQVLHATSLTPRQYVWGKYAACLASFLVILALHVAGAMFFNHLLSDADSAEFIGPFAAAAYLKPALFFGLPTILFVAGTTFLIGEWTRKPILVFVVPVLLFIVCAFFLWNWSPSWLDPRINRILMLVDPSGFRWLDETWMKVDMGVDFYNSQPIGLDAGFVVSRLLFSAIGLGSVFLTARHFARSVRRSSARGPRLARVVGRKAKPRTDPPCVPLASLGMRTRRPGFLRGLVEVARVELRELRSQPGLYIFVPIIVIQVTGNSMLAVGAFDTPLLNTPGTMAVRSLGVITTLTCLLMMFYVVESLRREASTQLASIYYATPVRTAAIIFGKALANSLVAIVMLAAALAAMAVVLAIQGRVRFDVMPFLLVWGLLLLPTLFLWSAFVSAVYAFTRSRYTAYGVALAALVYTVYKLIVGEITWVGNWPLYNTVQWSDMGVFELNRTALIYSRVLAVGAAIFFVAVAVRVFPRRSFDPTHVLLRLQPRTLLRHGAHLLPIAAVPLAMAFLLHAGVDAGFQGEQYERRAKDYWRKNFATWKEVPQPDLARVDIELELEPELRWMKVDGAFELQNLHDDALDAFALTSGLHWRDLSWTVNGEAAEPEDREGLFVFRPDAPLAAGGTIEVGFQFEASFPDGMTKKGGGAGQFIVPSGVVLTSFQPVFAPVIGFLEGRGVDEDNGYDAKEYSDDFYVGVTRSVFGTSQPYDVRMRITAPRAYTMNSVGTLVEESEEGDKKTVVWETEHPVRFFNVVGGKWDVRRGEGTAIYYHPEHVHNIDEMIGALDAARVHYSDWFYPYPWNELKLSEFPSLAGYAQGFPTDITFSESIGFLTKSDSRSNAAFLVTAHEAAHQWWGNLLHPGDGPGGNVLSEGMAHFSTTLLFEEVKGIRARIAFCKQIEDRYNDSRHVDSERALVKLDGTRAGDNTVLYDKGGWVFWMHLNAMGRENALSGLRAFIGHFAEDRDHAVLQDYVAHMRPFAPDEEAYDAFVEQWLFDVILPEYRILSVATEPSEGGWLVRARIENAGTGRMPVQVAATSGERFVDEEDPVVHAAEDAAAEGAYQEARVELVLGAGESGEVVIPCGFRPERLVIDPDALVLQRGRSRAEKEL
ncbi:MAG: hypothetical protein GY711_04040 [bacterium]|nr:hypothetical protein [bacterium]